MNKRNKTGGRTKGTPNKATVIHRDYLQNLLNQQGEKLEIELSNLEGKDYINVLLQFMEFVIPKIQRQQILINNEFILKPKEPIIIENYDETTEQSTFSVYFND